MQNVIKFVWLNVLNKSHQMSSKIRYIFSANFVCIKNIYLKGTRSDASLTLTGFPKLNVAGPQFGYLRIRLKWTVPHAYRSTPTSGE